MTDNDGDIVKNINEKYSDYLKIDYITFSYEKNEELNTLEPSLVEANIDSVDWEKFKLVISKNGSMKNKSKEEILSFMEKNKTEWSFRVFDSEEKIKYPEYILDAIK